MSPKILPSKEDVARAITAIAESRETHVEWLNHPEDCEDCRKATPTQIAGDHAHHAKCIEKYDHVLTVLRALPDMLTVIKLQEAALEVWKAGNATKPA